jgi:integrase
MSVHKRRWRAASGEVKEAWVADYKANGKRRIKTFATKREAVAFSNKTAVAISEGRHVADSASPSLLPMPPPFGSRPSSLDVVTTLPQSIRR